VGDREQAGIEVVGRGRGDEGLRQPGDAPHQVRPALRVELAEDVVEKQQRWVAVQLAEQVELGQLEGQDRRPLLAPRREARQVTRRRARASRGVSSPSVGALVT
jgi:hypothetical protein